jgi:pilus assembly protein FimV
MGSAGTTGGAGTTGAGGTTGGAGRGGATGGGGRGGATGAGGGAAASCSVCDKAGACCVAAANSLGQSSAGCSMFSTSSCNGMSGMAQSTLATNCQTVLTTAAPLNLAACK